MKPDNVACHISLRYDVPVHAIYCTGCSNSLVVQQMCHQLDQRLGLHRQLLEDALLLGPDVQSLHE